MTLEDRLAANARWILVGLIAASILFRVAYFLQIDGGPCSQWHRWEDGDPSFFDEWGRRIASGDALTDGGFHPLHGWHKRVAYEHFIRHPDEERALKSESTDPARALWNRWYGGPLLHQEPLYPYLIGITYRLFGPDPRWVYAWQMGLGVLINVLVWLIARRHFGERAGLLAAVLALLCAPVLYYEMTLIRTTLTVFASLGLVFLFERALDRETTGRWLTAGLGLGLALLLQTTFLLFGLAAAAIVAWRKRGHFREAARAGAAVAAGVLVCLAPAFARNAIVGAPLFGLSSVGTVTFVAANWPDSDPTRGWAVDERSMARLLTQTKGGFGAALRETLDRHTPATFIQLLGRKLKMLLHDYELPNNKNFLYFRLHAPVLYAGFIGFGLILPFALVGLYDAWKEKGRLAFLFALVVTAAAPMLLFYVLARFRAPLTMALIPFAAFGILRIVAWIQERRWKAVGVVGGVVVLTSLFVFRPLPQHMRAIRSADYRVAFRTFGGPRERAALERSDWASAEKVLAQTLKDEPAEVREMDGTPLPEAGFEIRQITDFFRAVHARRADYLKRLGRPEDARMESERAETLRRSLGGVPAAPWVP